jgi:hypothetical protein
MLGPTKMLAKDQKEALGLLAASLRGRMESVMQAHGFAVKTLHELVREGLVAADRGPAYFDPRAIVTVLEITDAGRKAITDEVALSPRERARGVDAGTGQPRSGIVWTLDNWQ